MGQRSKERIMLTKRETQPIRDMLQDAEWHFEDDEKREGSQKLWEATVAALGLIAEERGWACETEDDHWGIIDHLQAESPKHEWLDAGYITALSYQEYVTGIVAEDDELGLALPGGVWFVNELLEILESTA